MPPKAKITRDMIVAAGLKVVREEGEEALNVRRVAGELECSTQPVMYHFKTVSELKGAVYEAADELHTGYILAPGPEELSPMMNIGLQYIRFAKEERHLFRFLFQSDKFGDMSFGELMSGDGLAPLISPLCEAAELTEAQAREVFEVLFICVHGAASLIANNTVEYDLAHLEKMLAATFNGVIAGLKGGAS